MLTDTTDTPWLTRAACHGMDQTIFFPDDELPSSEIQKANRAAKRICADCPVREACLRDAMSRGESDGIWGGKSPKERQRLAGSNIQHWTEQERKEQAANMALRFDAGESIADIARAHGVNSKTVSDRLKMAGVAPRPTTARVDIDETEVASRYLAGESLTALSRAYGIDHKSISIRLERQGISRRPKKGAPGWSPDPVLS